MTSVSFTEEMKGHVAFGEEDFHQGERLGREQGTELMFHLTIETDDFDRFRADTSHPAVPRGWIGCEALGGRLAVEGGLFNLFVDHPDGGKRMLYRLHFRDGAGHPLTLNGFKVVRDHRGLDLWPDTTTLYTRLLSGHVDAREDAEAARVASGVVRILPLDFARQLTTFRARGGSAGRRGRALAGFAGLFIGDLFKVYGSRASEAAPAMPGGDGAGPTEARPRPGSGRPRPARPGDHLEHRLVPFEAGDGMGLNLVHVMGAGPPRKGPVLLIHGAGVRANLFRSPVATTFVEHLVDEGRQADDTNSQGPASGATESASILRSHAELLLLLRRSCRVP
jgi:cholesterol oxidase